MTTAKEWMDLVCKNADALRTVGVLHLTVDGCTVDLSPFVETEPVVTVRPEDFEPSQEEGWVSPLDDPTTWGREDGRVPMFPRAQEEGAD
jgi:hypothetical protein